MRRRLFPLAAHAPTTPCRAPRGTDEHWPATPAGFADFVRGLTATAKKVAPRFPGSGFAEDHLAPISRSPRQCITAPRTARVPLREYYRVFKRELEHEWYPGWVAELGIARWVSDHRWPGGCYSRRLGSSCNESLVEAPPSPPLLSSLAPPSNCSTRGVAVDVGAKPTSARLSAHSCLLLPTYYTPELADLVSEYATDDLHNFDYPRWSPSLLTPVPLPGPPLHLAAASRRAGGCRCAWNTTLWKGLPHLH